MHAPQIYPEVVARAVARRGSVHVFDRIDPTRTAHVVVDLQNGFMAPGEVAEIATAREIVPNVNRISTALRAAGGSLRISRTRSTPRRCEAGACTSTISARRPGASG